MKPLVTLIVGGLLICTAVSSRGAETPVHLATTQSNTPLTQALATLSKQAGIPLLTDDTVVGTLGATTLDKPTLEAMLTSLTSLTPGLTWQKVYLPQETPLPTGEALSRQILALKAVNLKTLKATQMVVTDAAQSTVTFRQSTETVATPPEGMQVVYLVTNESVRAKRQQDAKQKETANSASKEAADTQAAGPENAAPAVPGATPQAANLPVTQAVGGLQNTADVFGQMTPDQQRQALPLLFQQFQRMMRSIDPSVMNDLRQQWMQGFRAANP